MPQTWKQKKPAGWIIWCKSSVFIEPWNAATTTAGSGRAVRNHRPPEIAVFFFLLLFYFFSFNWFIPQQANIASAALITCRRLRAEVFFFFFKFNIRSSLTNIGGSNRSPDQLLLSPTTPTPPPSLPLYPSCSLGSPSLSLVAKKCSAAGQHLNEWIGALWATIIYPLDFLLRPAFNPEHMNFLRQSLLRSWTDRSEKMAQRVVFFLLWLFDRSFAGFPNQINIGKCFVVTRLQICDFCF